MAVIEVHYDPETQKRVAKGGKHVWKIIVENDAVSILKGAKLIGSGHWRGKGISKRYEIDDQIDDSQWGKIEHLLRKAQAEPDSDTVATPAGEPDPQYAEMIVELATGKISDQSQTRTDKRAKNAFEWKIVVDGTRVEVHADDEDAFARATWDGTALTDHQVRSSHAREINDYQWGVVQKAVVEVMTGRPAPMPPRSIDAKRLVDDEPRSSSTEATSSSSSSSTSSSTEAKASGGSGWWAFAAAVIALGATIISWRSMPKGDTIALVVTIILAVVTVGLLIYGLYGAGTRCPSCKAWYRRETTSRDITGTSTITKSESQDVKDSSGNKVGTTYVNVTYQRTTYLYHYKCKHCSHRWTGTGSSDRRV